MVGPLGAFEFYAIAYLERSALYTDNTFNERFRVFWSDSRPCDELTAGVSFVKL